jgi:hypothetical protein
MWLCTCGFNNPFQVVNCFRHLEDLDVFENEEGTEVSNEDGRSFTVLDVVSCMNNGQESNPVSSQSQVSACTEI